MTTRTSHLSPDPSQPNPRPSIRGVTGGYAPASRWDEVTIAHRMVVIYARHRATGHINDPDRFLVVLNAAGTEVARLDFSSSWELRTGSLRRICDLSGLTFAVETYETEADLLKARPQWTPAHVELEVEHPMENSSSTLRSSTSS